MLSHSHFACQFGAAVNVVSTGAPVKKKDEDSDRIECTEGAEIHTEHEGFEIISRLESDLDDVISFDACNSSQILVTSHKSTLLRIWDLEKNEVIKTVKSLHHLPIGLLEIHKVRAGHILQRKLKSNVSNTNSTSPSRSDSEDVFEVLPYPEAVAATRNDLIWTTVSGSQVKVWEYGGNQMSKAIQIGNIASIGYVTWSDDESRRLFVAERNISVIEAAKIGAETQYKITQTLEGHYSQVTGIEFAQDGSLMISGGRDKVLILWKSDGTPNKMYTRLKTIPFPESIESLVLMSPKDLYVALSPSDIYHYDIEKNVQSKASVLRQEIDEPIVALYAPVKSENSLRDSFFATTHSSTLYQIEKRKKRLKISKQYVGCLDEILCATFWNSSDCVVVANNTNIIKVYSISSGQCQFLRGHKDIVLTLDTQNDWLVSGSKDNSIMLWKRESDKPEIHLAGHLQSVTGVCFSPAKFLVFSVSEDNYLKLWDPKSSGSSLKSQLAHDKEIHSVHCSPNGAYLITSSRDKTAKIWDSETLDLVATLKGHKKSVWDARFSSWDRLAVTSSADTTIKIWSLISFACTQTLQGHLSSVLQAVFSNMGLQICSTSSDGTMRVWDIKTSTCVSTEECGDDKIWAVATQPDLSLIVTGSADSIITVWEDVTEEKVKEGLEKRKKQLEDEQKLTNVMRSGKWEDAFRLAIELDRPFTLLKIMRELKEPLEELTPIVKSLTTDLKEQLLGYIKKWNSNTKTSTEAQYLLNTVLKTTSFPLLEKEMPTEALIAYTQKHYNRLRTHRERIAVIQYFAKKEDILGS